MKTEASQVKVVQEGVVCRITIDRESEHNTMTDAVRSDLQHAFQAAEHMQGARVIVLTGAGQKTFCAGGKLKPTSDGSPFALEPGRFDHPVADLFRAMDRCNLPIIARVRGHSQVWYHRSACGRFSHDDSSASDACDLSAQAAGNVLLCRAL